MDHDVEAILRGGSFTVAANECPQLDTPLDYETSFLAIFGPKYRFETKIVSMKPF